MGQPEQRINLLHVDDEPTIRRAIRRILAQRDILAFGAGSLAELDLFLESPEVETLTHVLTDGHLGAGGLEQGGIEDAIETRRRVKAVKPAVRVVLYTGQKKSASEVTAFDGYVLKGSPTDELIRAIRGESKPPAGI